MNGASGFIATSDWLSPVGTTAGAGRLRGVGEAYARKDRRGDEGNRRRVTDDCRPPQCGRPCVNRTFRGRAGAPSRPRANRGRRRDRRLWPTACRSSRPSCPLAGGRRLLFATSRAPSPARASSAQAALEPGLRWPREWRSQLTPQAARFSPSLGLAPLSPHGAAAQARQKTGPGDCPSLSRELFR